MRASTRAPTLALLSGALARKSIALTKGIGAPNCGSLAWQVAQLLSIILFTSQGSPLLVAETLPLPPEAEGLPPGPEALPPAELARPPLDCPALLGSPLEGTPWHWQTPMLCPLGPQVVVPWLPSAQAQIT